MKKHLHIILLFLLVYTTSFAQRFPVRVLPVVNPPAPVNFYDYADGSTVNSPLRVQLLLGDLGIVNRQIRLKIFFEGNGIAFEGADNVIGATPLFIDGGTPLILGNAELAPYFELQNLRGISSNIYRQTIPEGSYQFCFEVYDVIRGIRLSEKTCATTFIFKNEPPLLNLPLNKSNIEPLPVDNIVFQWTPRHINVSNVEYELSLVEIWDNNVDPQTAFLSSPPVFQTTNRATSYVYGPSQPQLLPNKRYAWQVRARALKGAEEIGLFRNQGKSEIFWFSKTANCDTPTNVYAEPKGLSKMNVFWDEDPSTYSEYTIAYREKGRANSRWFTKRTNAGWATVWDLKPNTTYEYKVKGKCKFQYSDYTKPKVITTGVAEDATANYNCGIVPDAVAITNREGHPNLLIGDRITAGDFMITITDITSEDNGVISGSGFVRVPYFEMARFGVVFNNILVNTDYQLAEGEIVTLYDPVFGEDAVMEVEIPLTQWLNKAGQIINNLLYTVQDNLDRQKITPQQAKDAIAVINEQEQRLEVIEENKKKVEKLKEKGKEEEAEQLAEENKQIQKEVDQQLSSIPEQLGLNNETTDSKAIAIIEKDTYFDGLIDFGDGKSTIKHKRLDSDEIIDFSTIDSNHPPPDKLNYSFPYDGKTNNIIVTHSGSSPEVIDVARQRTNAAKSDELNLYLHYNASAGTVGYKINFGSNYIDKLNSEDYEEVLKLYQEAVFNVLYNQSFDRDSLAKVVKDGLLNSYGIFKQVLEEVRLPEHLWDQYTHKGEEYYIESLTAGLTDGAIDEIKSIPLLLSIVVDYTTDKKTRAHINQSISTIDVEKIFNKFVNERSELYNSPNKDKLKHETGKDIIAAGTFISSGGLAALGKIKKGVDFVEALAKKSKNVAEDVANVLLKKLNEFPDLLKKLDNLKDAKLRAKFLDDFKDGDIDAIEAFGKNPDLVDSWKVLDDAGVDDAIRKNVEHLEVFKNRIDEYPDVDFSKVNRVLDNQLDPDGFIKNKLGGTVKGDDHLRTLVGDFENVPGVSSKKFVDNSLPKSKVSSPAEWADPDLDLPDWAHSTFTNKATPRDLPEGTKIYRVIGDGQNPKGAFWTYDLPTNKSELYGGTAVRPEWNNGTSFVEYTVPEGGLKIWDGPTASQRVIDDVDDFMLEGGSTQIFIPDNVRADFPDLPINNMIWD